ncbi:MAG: tetratricopeptide repeat protein [Acidobacteriota bacterium]
MSQGRRALRVIVLTGLLVGCRPELADRPEPRLTGFADAAVEQIETLHAAIDATPNDPTTWGDLGRLYHAYGLWAEAIVAYDNATRLASRDPRWPFLRAHAHRQAGATTPAIEDFERALALDVEPRLPAHAWAARLLVQEGRAADAERHLEAALAIDPTCATCLFFQAQLAAGRGDHETAVTLYQQVLTLQPHADRVWSPLSQSLRARGDDEAATAALARRGEQQVSLDDPLLRDVSSLAISAPGRVRTALERYRAGDPRSALLLLEEAIALDPEHAPAHLNRGVVARALDDLDTAEQAFRRVLELAPDATAHFNLGVVLAARGDMEQAVEQYERALERDAGHTGARVNLANQLVRTGRCADAETHFNAVVELAPQIAAAHQGLVMCALLGESWVAAAERIERGRQALPNESSLRNLDARLHAASPLRRLRDPVIAVALAERLVDEAPTLDHVETLAMALASEGRFNEAMAWQQRAIDRARQLGFDERVARLEATLFTYQRRQPPVLRPGG